MIQFCEKIVIERKFTENILWVFKDNMKARKFYEKMGHSYDGKEEYIEKYNAIEIRYC